MLLLFCAPRTTRSIIISQNLCPHSGDKWLLFYCITFVAFFEGSHTEAFPGSLAICNSMLHQYISTSMYKKESVYRDPYGYRWHGTVGLVNHWWPMVWALGHTIIIAWMILFFLDLIDWVWIRLWSYDHSPQDCNPYNHAQVITVTFLKSQANQWYIERES